MVRKVRANRRSNRQFRPKKSAVARVSRPMRRAIKQVIDRQQERKYRSISYQRLCNATLNTTTMEMWPCIPTTAQAGAGTTSSSQRIGQKVTCARAYTDFHVSFAQGITGSKDLTCKLWVLSSKELKNYDDIANIGQVGNPRQTPITFLNDGNGGSLAPAGTLDTLTLPVENETWTSLKEFKFQLVKSSGVIENSSSGYATAPPFAYVADASKTCRMFRVYHKVPKIWNYDGNLLEQYPTNVAPVWCLAYAYTDGTSPSVGNVEVLVEVRNHLEFYDA